MIFPSGWFSKGWWKENLTDDTESPFKLFMAYACEMLEIQQPPLIEYLNEPLQGDQPSFGCYNPSNKSIQICIGGRNFMDSCRTLAHELVHHKQNELGQLQAESGKTGSPEENEANSVAAMLLRNFGKKYPEAYKKVY